ncbi:Aste57867_16104 [Aphanomyces stellatus]|uniref:Aste57867_16104 protein n=1 Tax=Aphanomyces stellatus TaxID=120398 RepID=A0A485L7V8_9STRA|nr:hypothetical protein As57867_016048 [Aphanomyces stellatus]VFT92887.1 Aste57867_16104 [Aphanomyces stellatus]
MQRKVQFLSRAAMSAADEKAVAAKAKAQDGKLMKGTDAAPSKEGDKATASEKEIDADDATDDEDDSAPSQPEAEAPIKISRKLQARNALSKKVQTTFSLRMVLFPILAAIAVGVYKIKFEGVRLFPSPRSLLVATNQSSSSSTTSGFAPGVFDYPGNKYASDIVHITTRKLLSPDSTCVTAPTIVRENVHVEEAMGHADTLRATNHVLLMLNAHDHGVLVEWSPSAGCLHKLAATAAAALGADADYFPNGLRLYDSMGEPIVTPAQLDRERLAYILIDFHIWVWPGIRVGYTRVVEGVKMTTVSLSPLVFDCEHFFTLDEANAIIQHGSDKLSRSPVDSTDAVDGYHADRTSHTAFLEDTLFTRDFRRRSARLARLPSPSFVERMQLVRYEAGQFFRKHEDYFESKDFLGKKNAALGDYATWAAWAADVISSLEDKSTLPEAFWPGGKLFPNPADVIDWQLNWLAAFLDDCERSNFFQEKADLEWGSWIKENVESKAHGIVEILLESKGYMLPYMIAAWEKKAGDLPALHYTTPKPAVSGVTHYFRWIRWVKERIEDLGDQAPDHVRPTGPDYPTFRTTFQTKLAAFILEDYTVAQLTAMWGAEMATWLVDNKQAEDVILDGARQFTPVFHAAVAAWTKRAGIKLFSYTPPKQVQHFEPNRYVTLFLYLNDVDEGGETVFPHSKERLVTDIKRDGMDECSEGLAVPPLKLHMSLFYGQTWDNQLEPKSLHGGCPPAKGVKFGANSFTWNADADEGSQAWGFGG